MVGQTSQHYTPDFARFSGKCFFLFPFYFLLFAGQDQDRESSKDLENPRKHPYIRKTLRRKQVVRKPHERIHTIFKSDVRPCGDNTLSGRSSQGKWKWWTWVLSSKGTRKFWRRIFTFFALSSCVRLWWQCRGLHPTTTTHTDLSHGHDLLQEDMDM